MWKQILQHSALILPGLVVAVLVVLATSQTVFAFESPISIQTMEGRYIYDTHPCPGWNQQISVSGEGVIQACVTGEKYKLARYYPANGGVGYALQFPYDPLFYGLDACGVAGCVLSAGAETFVRYERATSTGYRAHIYKDFVVNLEKYIPSTGSGFRYKPAKPPNITITHPNGTNLFVAASAVSVNGKWVAIELKSYGILLVDVSRGDVRRVVAPGATYGLMSDPTVEMAITDDGRSLAVMGARTGTRIVRVDATCGDRFTLATGYSYQGAVTSCETIPIDTGQLMDNFQWAGHPSFDTTGQVLSFLAHDRSGAVQQVIVRSSGFPSASATELVAIGDSFTSGEGETDDSHYLGSSKNPCHVSRRSYVHGVGDIWRVATLNAACSGARIDDILHNDKQGQAQLDRVSMLRPRVILLGIGGNDAGLMGKLTSCVAPGTCEWALAGKSRRQAAEEIRSLYSRLRTLYGKVRATSGSELLVVGYPQIITVSPTCPGVVGVLLDTEERQFMQEALRYLNAVIKQAATDEGIRYVDLSESFSGHKLCENTETPAMNAVRFGDDFSPIKNVPQLKIIGAESFHPTPFGHRLHVGQITSQFPSLFSISSCSTCIHSGRPPEPTSYWKYDESLSIIQRSERFVEETNENRVYTITMPAGSFAPNDIVTVEVHSKPEILGTRTATAIGALNVEIVLPAHLEQGVHSIHLFGTLPTGGKIDYYDFATVPGVVPEAPYLVDGVNGSLVWVDHEPEYSTFESSPRQRSAVLGSRTPTVSRSLDKAVNADTKQSDHTLILVIILGVTAAGNIGLFVYHRWKMSHYSSG